MRTARNFDLCKFGKYIITKRSWMQLIRSKGILGANALKGASVNGMVPGLMGPKNGLLTG